MLSYIRMSQTISENIAVITKKINLASKSSSLSLQSPRLVAVSKTKPVDDIVTAYECGIRHFGENYIQELETKSSNEKIVKQCPDIKWHYIGAIQTKKIPKLSKIANLHIIETLDDQKHASIFNERSKDLPERLKIMIQINTSGEEGKNGIPPASSVDFVKFVMENCPYLNFVGLMTIGSISTSMSHGGDQNPDFMTLVRCRKTISEELNISFENIELSMGMSNDFEEAIRAGSTNVRVGSSIFGTRTKIVS